MTWLGVWLVGVGLADLVTASRRAEVSRWGVAVGLVAVVALGALAGLFGWGDLVALLGAVVSLVLWVRWSRAALASGAGHVRSLAVLALGGAWLVGFSGWSSVPGGLLGRWLGWAELPTLFATDPGRLLLVVGLLVANLATGNVVVRLVLVSIGAIRPLGRTTTAAVAMPEPALQLRGGRLLGPMERLVILGLGLAGQLTAAALVIAAKSLIRFPELQSKRSREGQYVQGAGIDEVTEYFLVGSFVSWLLALGSLVLSH